MELGQECRLKVIQIIITFKPLQNLHISRHQTTYERFVLSKEERKGGEERGFEGLKTGLTI